MGDPKIIHFYLTCSLLNQRAWGTSNYGTPPYFPMKFMRLSRRPGNLAIHVCYSLLLYVFITSQQFKHYFQRLMMWISQKSTFINCNRCLFGWCQAEVCHECVLCMAKHFSMSSVKFQVMQPHDMVSIQIMGSAYSLDWCKGNFRNRKNHRFSFINFWGFPVWIFPPIHWHMDQREQKFQWWKDSPSSLSQDTDLTI